MAVQHGGDESLENNVYSGKHPQTLLRKGAGRGRIKAVS